MTAAIAWASAHSTLMAGLAVAVIDFMFGVNPNLKSNGILHFVVLQLQSMLPPAP